MDDIRSKIVRKGICLYAGVRKYGVYLCKEDILYGTGDYEDAPGIADDQNMECYTVYFGDLLDVNTIRASAGQYKSFEKAVEAAESSEGFQNWEVAMDNHVGFISYSDKEREIVRKGVDAIREVLMGSDSGKKKSLLLALDWFMDPYYKQDHYIAEFRDELIDLLQTVVISSNDDEVSDDALVLLDSYAWPPFEILEKNMEMISEQMKPYVLEMINIGRE